MSDQKLLTDIQNLSEPDLRQQLLNHDIKPGPLAKTRKIYEKRLFKAKFGYDFGKKPKNFVPKSIEINTPTIEPQEPIKSKRTRSNSRSRRKIIEKESPDLVIDVPDEPKQKRSNSRSRRKIVENESPIVEIDTPNEPKKRNNSRSRRKIVEESSSDKNINLKSPSRHVPEPKIAKSLPKFTETPQIYNSVKIVKDYTDSSNDEIRARLKELGAKVGPINSQSVRKLMLKKLQKLEQAGLQSTILEKIEQTSSFSDINSTNISSSSTIDAVSFDPKSTGSVNSDYSLSSSLKYSLDRPQISGNFSSEDDDATNSITTEQTTNKTDYSSNGHTFNPINTSNVLKSLDFEPNQSSFKAQEISMQTSQFLAMNDDSQFSTEDEVDENFPNGVGNQNFKCEPIKNVELDYKGKRLALARMSAGIYNEEADKILNSEKSDSLKDESETPSVNLEVEKQSKFFKFVQNLPKLFLLTILLTSIFSILFVQKQNSIKSSSPTSHLKCQSNDPSLCLSRNDMDKETNHLFSKVFQQLNEVAALSICKATNQSPKMKLLDLIEVAGTTSLTVDQDHHHISSKIVKSVIEAFHYNTKYGVVMYDENSKLINDPKLLDYVKYLEIPDPLVEHEKCKFHKVKIQFFKTWNDKIWTLRNRMILAALLVLILTVKYLKYKRSWKIEYNETVKSLVSKIITVLESQNKEQPINHIRDTLIKIDDRKKLINEWQDSIEYIRENESRVSFGVKEINGELSDVISWTVDDQSTLTCLNSLKYSTRWSGCIPGKQILDKSPQGCVALKIREIYSNQVDVNNKMKQELLLQELMGQTNLILNFENEDKIWPLHYGFEEHAGYFRFGDSDEATKFYNCINGQWFDKKLLTPKFVHDVKYFQRFPSAKKSIYNRK